MVALTRKCPTVGQNSERGLNESLVVALAVKCGPAGSVDPPKHSGWVDAQSSIRPMPEVVSDMAAR